MRVIVVGLGIQGKKRYEIAKKWCVATVDPIRAEADFKNIKDIPLASFDAALICTPDNCKLEILHYLLFNKKHLLVEKPLLAANNGELNGLKELAEKNKVTCYTAYNHRFEPHFVRMKELIEFGTLGTLYHCRLFYGNGTARDVRNSLWRDEKEGVITDLGSHLLDTLLFWFGSRDYCFELTRCHRFENRSPDHALLSSRGSTLAIDLEMSLLSWRNHFTCDLVGERGSAHIESLCKWGPSKFTYRRRKLPSGRPDEETVTLVQPDPTWEAEFAYFKKLCERRESNIENDIFINTILQGCSLRV